MPTSYPPTWVERVKNAQKLAPDAETALYLSPDGQQQVSVTAVQDRIGVYLKLEAARRRRKLSKEDEQICREFVLLVDNWRTGQWEKRPPTQPTATRAGKRRLAEDRAPNVVVGRG